MKENIWGKSGCELPNGKLCKACCVLPEIELEGQYVSIAKPAHSPCPFLAEEGCSLHATGRKKEACKAWHCSEAGGWHKLELIAQGLALGDVSKEEAQKAAGRIDDSEEVVKMAGRLKKITWIRPLEAREPDET